MRNSQITASQWMIENGHSWTKKKRPPQGKKSKYCSSEEKRSRYAKNVGEKDSRTIREFVHDHRNSATDDCIFVPASLEGRPARLDHCNQTITAARYMALLTMGAPKSTGMVVRHLCANGHLSCINPRHLAWGAPADNIADAIRHRACGDSIQDKINAIT